MKALGLGFLAACAMLAASPGAANADCQCLANGREFEHGELTCIRLPTSTFLARCDKVLNNSSWMKVQDGCPAAEASPVEGELAGQRPMGHGAAVVQPSVTPPASAAPIDPPLGGEG